MDGAAWPRARLALAQSRRNWLCADRLERRAGLRAARAGLVAACEGAALGGVDRRHAMSGVGPDAVADRVCRRARPDRAGAGRTAGRATAGVVQWNVAQRLGGHPVLYRGVWHRGVRRTARRRVDA